MQPLTLDGVGRSWEHLNWLCSLSLLLSLLLPACAPRGGLPAPASHQPSDLRVALLPFENHSGSRDAVKVIMPAVKAHLSRLGYGLLDDQDIEAFLVRNRIRRTGAISGEHARALHAVLKVDLIAVGAIEVFNEVDQPQVGLSCRIVDARRGTILWAESIGVAGDDYRTFLGLGAIRTMESLQVKAIERLFRTIGEMGVKKGGHLSGQDVEGRRILALLPFDNISGRRNAGRIFADAFITRLIQASPYGVVEPGQVRQELIHLKVRDLAIVGNETLSKLGRNLGADYLCLGSIDDYREEIREGFPPRVAVHVRVLNVAKGRIVWAGGSSMTGDDFILVLDVGKIRSVIPLVKKAADRIIEGMVERKTRDKTWKSVEHRWMEQRS